MCDMCILVLEFLFTVSFFKKKVQMTSVIKGIKSWGNTGLYIRHKYIHWEYNTEVIYSIWQTHKSYTY